MLCSSTQQIRTTVATMPPERNTQTRSDMPITSGSSEEIMMMA